MAFGKIVKYFIIFKKKHRVNFTATIAVTHHFTRVNFHIFFSYFFFSFVFLFGKILSKSQHEIWIFYYLIRINSLVGRGRSYENLSNFSWTEYVSVFWALFKILNQFSLFLNVFGLFWSTIVFWSHKIRERRKGKEDEMFLLRIITNRLFRKC